VFRIPTLLLTFRSTWALLEKKKSMEKNVIFACNMFYKMLGLLNIPLDIVKTQDRDFSSDNHWLPHKTWKAQRIKRKYCGLSNIDGHQFPWIMQNPQFHGYVNLWVPTIKKKSLWFINPNVSCIYFSIQEKTSVCEIPVWFKVTPPELNIKIYYGSMVWFQNFSGSCQFWVFLFGSWYFSSVYIAIF
jgi:hypothetical protein